MMMSEQTIAFRNRSGSISDDFMGCNTDMNGSTEDIGVIVVSRIDGVRELSFSSFRDEYIRIGRDTGNVDIPVSSKTVGRQHGYFHRQDGRYYYYDNYSSNGSYNLTRGRYMRLESGQPAGPLRNGMIFVIGKEKPEFDESCESVLLIITSADTSQSFGSLPLGNQACTIGRDPDCNIVLNQPAISRIHARIYPYNDRYVLEDCGSTNGLFVNGEKMTGSCYLREKDIVQLAGNILIFSCNAVFYKSTVSGIQLSAVHLGKQVDHGKKQILSDVNINIESNEFVAIVGGSGAGKSTLLKALGGYDQDYLGMVMYNGIPLRSNYGMLKNIIGYVPQEDIVYENLTLWKMLYYTAEMKLPKETSAGELHDRIQEVLSLVELSEHQDTMIRNLSGGQKKRASIAVELLADPGMFFLDEPTSGLDPGTEKKLMSVLSRLSKSKGKTIVMVTHTTQSLDLCDRILFMGKGGQVCFLGTPAEALQFFQADSLIDVYNLLEDDSDSWAERFCMLYAPDQEGPEKKDDKLLNEKKVSFFKQLNILTRRYFSLTINDRARLLLLLLQPVVIALLLKVVAPVKSFKVYEPTKEILFTFVCAAIWIGIFNTIQEICKERNIVKREYMSNLKLTAYILSKYIVQLLISMLQAAEFTAIFILTVVHSTAMHKGVMLPVGIELFLTTWLTIYCSSTMGLLISAMMKTGDQAMAVSPFLFMMQLLFSGVLFELRGMSNLISVFTISRWSVEAMGNIANITKLESLYKGDPGGGRMFAHSMSHLYQSWGLMILFVIVFGLTSLCFLQNVSKDR